MKPQPLFWSSSTADPEGNVTPCLVPMILAPEFYKTIFYSLCDQEHLCSYQGAYQPPCIKIRVVKIYRWSFLGCLIQLSSLCHFAKCLSVPTSLNTHMDPNRCLWSNTHKLPLGGTLFSKIHTKGWLKHSFYCK